MLAPIEALVEPAPEPEPAPLATEAPIEPEEPYREPLPPLPDALGYDRAALISRDPSSAYAYWEVTEASVQAARAQAKAEGELTLRVAYTTEPLGPERARLHSVRDWVGRYIEDDLPEGANVRAEVGLSYEGRFTPIVTMPTVTLPRRSPAGGPIRFVNVRPSGQAPNAEPAPTPPQAPKRASKAVASSVVAPPGRTDRQTLDMEPPSDAPRAPRVKTPSGAPE